MTRPGSSFDEADVRVVAGASPRAPSRTLQAPTIAAPVDEALGPTCVEAARRRAQHGPHVLLGVVLVDALPKSLRHRGGRAS